ncbi:MAG TPA: hypothetical protein EYG86_05995 [Crocinitomicaceae bacterium]|nr:hypothetical protein [Crocinitomicaceae bacterium]
MKNTNTINKVRTDEITVTLRPDGIVHLYIHPETEISKNTLLSISSSLKQLVSKRSIPLIVEAGEFVSVSKEAKEYAKNYESEVDVISRSVITKNLAQKIIANYYYKNRTVSSPVEEFDTIEEGIKWLKSF